MYTGWNVTYCSRDKTPMRSIRFEVVIDMCSFALCSSIGKVLCFILHCRISMVRQTMVRSSTWMLWIFLMMWKPPHNNDYILLLSPTTPVDCPTSVTLFAHECFSSQSWYPTDSLDALQRLLQFRKTCYEEDRYITAIITIGSSCYSMPLQCLLLRRCPLVPSFTWAINHHLVRYHFQVIVSPVTVSVIYQLH